MSTIHFSDCHSCYFQVVIMIMLIIMTTMVSNDKQVCHYSITTITGPHSDHSDHSDHCVYGEESTCVQMVRIIACHIAFSLRVQ